MKFFKVNLKKRWMNYLNKLAKANQDLYGSQRLDCCDLDKKKK
ncbi:LDCC motif putative metal-binding protein [Oceanispirochaeta crateris]|nr:LDCC motif putative metal-binding protein [Oceanispirochaeta crateris]